jgi:plastocyanin
MSRRAGGALLLLVLALLATGGTPPASARGGHVEAIVKDQDGKPVVDAVVSMTPAGGPGSAPPTRPPDAVMDQVNKEFVPLVLPVMVGTAVSFPTRDNIRHHVYSFSSARKFELPLYIGTPAAPIVFDKPGPVALGCNIHDWMVAYIYVVATPHFAKTVADGKARLEGMPAGTYEARVWHARLRGATEATTKPITLTEDEEGRLTFTLSLKKPESRPAPRREPYEGPQQSG